MRNYPVPLLIAFTATILLAAGREESRAPATEMKPAKPAFSVTPIGRIEKQGNQTFIRLDAQHQHGLLGLEEWSHVWVFYWFDRNDTPERRATLRVHPRGNPDNPLTGVFATRSPLRPNLIALSLCRVVAIKGADIEIESIDAFDQTPVIDLKPYMPGLDRPEGAVNVPKWARPPAHQSGDGLGSDTKQP